ncbi:MAG: RelA/SpoT domain-containing protein [Coprobacter sp.]|nr:RelA/SpoT domain-containing protein [Coprobacter sp.]
MVYSNNDYDKLGDRIRNNPLNISDDDYEMLQHLRLSYKSSMSLIFNYIEKVAHRIDHNCVCTYRIKRIESIVSKLDRFPTMRVNRAEDIAGCRCILSTEEQVYKLYNYIIKNSKKIPFEIKGKINDYIQTTPKSGYKSIHLNVSLKGENKRIEIQIRSVEHHNWATLVEITDLLFNLKIKEVGESSNSQLFKLHLLLSKPQEEISLKDINYITDTIIEYKYIQKLGDIFANNYIDVRNHWNSLKLQNNHFFLISTGQDGVPEISGFKDFDTAEACYFERFINNKSNKNIVLTHLRRTNFAKISVAYSNYFLTFNNTIIKILGYLSKAVEVSFKKNKIFDFAKYYQAFLDIMLFWMNTQIIEIKSFHKDINLRKSRLKYNEWACSIAYGINLYNDMFKTTQAKLKFKLSNPITYAIMRRKHKNFEIKVNAIIALGNSQ